jgi:hypothetical protein
METIIPRTKNKTKKVNDVIKNLGPVKNFDYESEAKKFFDGVNDLEEILGDAL